jgi:enoyl-CoA hydratase/carnithine racemase
VTDVETVLTERRGSVLLVTLNRPDRLNAWTEALESSYFTALSTADADPDVRAIVVTGAGRGFCAGADMTDLEQVNAGNLTALAPQPRPRHYPMTIRKPLIAAINGAAAGLGLVEALYCDIRFAVPAAKLTTSFTRRGLIAEYGIAWLLPRLVGPSRALDLLLSARVVRGEEALSIGLVDHLAEPDALVDTAIAYATDLATNCSPTSMAVVKDQVRRALDSTFATATAEAETEMLASFHRPDFTEGITSYLENRPPDFPGLT